MTEKVRAPIKESKIKIIGFDESGSIGDPYIIFAQVEFDEEMESDLFINNLRYSTSPILQEREIRNWEIKRKVKWAQNLLDNDLIKIRFYKLNVLEQNKILKDVFKYQGEILYKEREKLIGHLNRNRPGIKYFEYFIGQLHHYRDPDFLPEFCIKSYSYLYILNRMSRSNWIYNTLKENNKVKVQIDGGNVMTFWWYDLFETHQNKELLRNNLFINGISHGDNYYLSMNLAHLLSNILRSDISRYFDHPIEQIKYNFDDIDFPKESFYDRIWSFLVDPFFKRRILLIGQSELFKLIPYILNQINRSYIYSAFRIEGKIHQFFRKFKVGNPKNSITIYSEKLSKIDKDNIAYCKKRKIETVLITDFKEEFVKFFDMLEQAAEYYQEKTITKVRLFLESQRRFLS